MAINAQGKAQSACCLPQGFVRLLFIQQIQAQIHLHICMNICTCIVYDLFYLAFTFYAHAKVKSFICKYAYALEYVCQAYAGNVSLLWAYLRLLSVRLTASRPRLISLFVCCLAPLSLSLCFLLFLTAARLWPHVLTRCGLTFVSWFCLTCNTYL